MESHQQLEHNIDFALKLLGNATPPEGMEQRVCRHARLSNISGPQPRLSLPFAALPGVACAVAIFTFCMASPSNQNLAGFATNVEAPANKTAATSHGNHPMKADPHAIPDTPRQPHVVNASVGRGSRMHFDEQQLRAVVLASDDAANAPSQAAPKLPLTKQERLLLAAAYGQTSQPQIAALRRPVWPLRDPADDEDFRKFFDSQTPIATEGENE